MSTILGCLVWTLAVLCYLGMIAAPLVISPQRHRVHREDRMLDADC